MGWKHECELLHLLWPAELPPPSLNQLEHILKEQLHVKFRYSVQNLYESIPRRAEAVLKGKYGQHHIKKTFYGIRTVSIFTTPVRTLTSEGTAFRKHASHIKADENIWAISRLKMDLSHSNFKYYLYLLLWRCCLATGLYTSILSRFCWAFAHLISFNVYWGKEYPFLYGV
jgi:hypothetical protein